MADDTPVTEPHLEVDTDLPCFQCGYNLRALRVAASCPECGSAVKHSIASYRVERWPFTAVEPCRLLAFGLISMLAIGLGLIPWTIGLVMLIRRMPTGMHWAVIRHATWLSLLSVFACMAAAFIAPSYAWSSFRFVTLLTCFAASLTIHYVCVFVIAIRITYRAKIYLAMGFAAACLLTQLAVVCTAAVVEQSMEDTVIALIVSGVLWTIPGSFYWAYVANVLDEQKQALLRVAMDLASTPPPTRTL